MRRRLLFTLLLVLFLPKELRFSRALVTRRLLVRPHRVIWRLSFVPGRDARPMACRLVRRRRRHSVLVALKLAVVPLPRPRTFRFLLPIVGVGTVGVTLVSGVAHGRRRRSTSK